MLVDLTGLDSAPISNNSVIDPNRYIGVIEKIEEVTSSKKGTPGINVDYRIENGPVQVSGASAIGRHVFQSIWVPNEPGKGRDIGLSRVARLFHACGVDRSSMDISLLQGKSVLITVGKRTYNGEESNEVTDTKPVPSGM